jgi:hypothetical protein
MLFFFANNQLALPNCNSSCILGNYKELFVVFQMNDSAYYQSFSSVGTQWYIILTPFIKDKNINIYYCTQMGEQWRFC